MSKRFVLRSLKRAASMRRAKQMDSWLDHCQQEEEEAEASTGDPNLIKYSILS
jgi:hypothetical protein